MLPIALGVYTDTEMNCLPYMPKAGLKSANPLAEEVAISEGFSVPSGLAAYR